VAKSLQKDNLCINLQCLLDVVLIVLFSLHALGEIPHDQALQATAPVRCESDQITTALSIILAGLFALLDSHEERDCTCPNHHRPKLCRTYLLCGYGAPSFTQGRVRARTLQAPVGEREHASAYRETRAGQTLHPQKEALRCPPVGRTPHKRGEPKRFIVAASAQASLFRTTEC
jgi:hypothetical protein